MGLALLVGFLSGCGAGKGVRSGTQTELDGAALVRTARSQLGAGYRPGGSSPSTGFDCSGFIQWVFLQHGVALPRQSHDQFQSGVPVGWNRLHRGDLVFFETEKKGASHVGIYAGEDVFIHSSNIRGTVREDRLSDPYWRRRYLGARRVGL